MKALLRLYPAAWRERYEDEVAQLLDDTAAGIGAAPGLVRGAYEAHRHPARLGLPDGGIRRWCTREHLAAIAAIAGGAFWLGTYVALWIAAMRMSPNPDLGSIALLAGAGPLLVLAIIGLLPRGSGRWRDPLVTLGAPTMTLVGAALMGTMLIRNGLSPKVELVPYDQQDVLLAGTALVLFGSFLAAAAMWGRGIASRRSLACLGAACLLDLLFLGIWVHVGFVYEVTSFAGAAAGMMVALGWMAVGWSAVRQPGPAAEQQPVIDGTSLPA